MHMYTCCFKPVAGMLNEGWFDSDSFSVCQVTGRHVRRLLDKSKTFHVACGVTICIFSGEKLICDQMPSQKHSILTIVCVVFAWSGQLILST